jgi:hypothetical protein
MRAFPSHNHAKRRVGVILALVAVVGSSTSSFVADALVRPLIAPSSRYGIQQRYGFQEQTQQRIGRHGPVAGSKTTINMPLSMVGDLFTDMAVTVGSPDYHIAGKTAVGDVVLDKNGKEFTKGGVVRVCVDGLKAFQINAKGQGTFDAKKAFVLDATKKFLVLPIGLRGTIMRVYDESVVSANLPIQVKFVNGEHTEEGYDTPTSFLMHFMPNEVECV